MDPIIYGDYPFSMRSIVTPKINLKNRLNLLLIKTSVHDINLRSLFFPASRNGILIGPQEASSELHVYPRGLRDLLLYVKEKYNNPLVYITENGIDEFNNASLPLEQALKDPMRIDYYHRHLLFLERAIKEGVNVKGYFAWSLLDGFEWSSGYTVRFDINFVDYKNGNKRYPKQSAIWFKNFLQKLE
ncbi:beta-glucosidase 13-like [Mangifera indica]|uniref:beta-glucosidase 13-like n=1 Tax=Mangifera indica TaxID=29780 RepID=UPI001CFAB1E2|nr:beta-glucosidase 13-like [Mangifera indica]